jgi:predicted PurR-regulated permease PerM
MAKSPKALKNLLIIGCLLMILALILWGLGSALIPLLASFTLAYLTFPFIKKLESKGLRRHHAVTGVFVLLTFLLVLISAIAIPILASDFKDLVQDLPTITNKAFRYVETLSQRAGYELDLGKEGIQNYIQQNISKISGSVFNGISKAIENTFSEAVSWIVSILNLFLFPLFFFYLINDFEKISDQIRSFVPHTLRPTLGRYAHLANRVLSGYLRGQLTVALILGGLYALGLWAIGLKFGLLVGLISGLISIIPYAGFTLGFSVALVIALTNYTGMGQVLGVVLVFSVVQGLEGAVITPKLVGNKVGLSSLSTLLAIIIGGNLFGFVGMILGVPAGAILKSLIADLQREYKNLEVYKK